MAVCDDCSAAFSKLEKLTDNKLRAFQLDIEQPQCRCQTRSVSPLSPGPVADAEILIRVVVAPTQIHKTKKRPNISSISAANTSGLSVMRKGIATDDIIRAVAKVLVDNARKNHGERSDQVGVFGVLEMRCETIRTVKADVDTHPAYCVYDTAQEKPEHGGASHAEAFQRVHNANEELVLERRRQLLVSVENTFIPVEEFRNGLLKDLAPNQIT